MDVLIANWKEWAWSAGFLILALAISSVSYKLLYRFAKRFAQSGTGMARGSLVRRSQGPARLILPITAALLVSPTLTIPANVVAGMTHLFLIALIGSITWLAVALLNVAQDVLSAKYRVDLPDNLRARRVETQVRVLRRTAAAIVVVIGVAAVLMTFPAIRNIGTGLFASAGVAGLIVGMAARPGLSNLLAGLQIALTEPIRLDDVVVVEGEWGRVEDIQATYVVIRIWDQRRLILPLSYFIEKPFQNWTRTFADLLATVYFHVDYTAPVDELRTELHRILESSPLWDGKVWNLQVTDAGQHSVELRALMSCSDSSSAWDLRCLVRERMIHFLQQHYPESLPRTRANLFRSQHLASPMETVEKDASNRRTSVSGIDG